ncbi:MAG: glucuronate isomerase [bacterium]
MPDGFIHDDFLLETKQARELYHAYAESLPIIDYHCHLSPAEIAGDKRWANIAQVWLYGDHYKWRQMRTAGVAERFCTGNATDREKFDQYAWVMPQALRNPLYHWSHLELKAYFGISDRLLSPDTADSIWKESLQVMATPEFSARGLMKKSKVEVVCTTDDPVDSLEHHRAIASEQAPISNPQSQSAFSVQVRPTWRPDKCWMVADPVLFNGWTDKLAAATNRDLRDLDGFIAALRERHDVFHAAGCRLSDRGICFIPDADCTGTAAAAIFAKARARQPVPPSEAAAFMAFMLHELAVMDAEKGWTMQVHYGVLRNNNSRQFSILGPDTGYDSIGDWATAEGMVRHFNRLDLMGKLPKTIIYNINPCDNELVATMIGNYQDGVTAGKMQFGSGWWFLDQLDGMTRQIESLSQLGLLSRFVGMLTDSRSFLSYTRHEYFRRLLCAILGDDMARGRIPNDMALVGKMVADISYHNARNYFGFFKTQ